MQIKELKPTEILTTKDFPVHNLNTLKIYFKICKEGHQKILPPTPVIPLSIGLPLLKSKDKKSRAYNQRLINWLDKNKNIKYMLVDGNHKTTALTLAHKKIHAMILTTNKDIKEVQALIKKGEIFGIYKIESIEKELGNMAKHFSTAKLFE